MNDKFKKLIEYIVNEDETRARELFHEIVVEKSREIYESMMDDEEDDEEDLDENFGAYEADESDDMIGDVEDDIDSDHEGDMDDASDELDSEMDMGDEEGEMGGSEEIEDRVVDLEDALDSLKAEFEELMKGEEGEDHMGDEDMEDMGDEDMEDMDSDEDSEDSDEDDMDEMFMREYREKVTAPAKGEGHEAAKGGSATINKQSIVAKKNDMGGTSKNLVQGGEAKGRPAPSAKTQTSAADPRDYKTGAAPKAVRSEVGGINKTAPIGSK